MRTYTRVFGTLTWLSTALMLVLQVLVVFGMILGKSEFDTTLIVIATALMLAAVIAFFAVKKYKAVPLLIAVAAGVLFVVITVMIANKYLAGSNWVDTTGFIKSWPLVYRHLSPLLIPLFMTVYWICWRQRLREEQMTEALLRSTDDNERDSLL